MNTFILSARTLTRRTFDRARSALGPMFAAALVATSCDLSAAVPTAAVPVDAGKVDQLLIDKGRYLATASDCIACHTSNKAKPMAGGHAIDSPVGKIFAPNITPSKKYGIGDYTEAEFADALRKGIRADGARLYPAMPYTAYARMTDEDIRALYAYFMHGVAPVDEPSPKTDLPFPLNQRAAMIGWNALFAGATPLEPDPSQSMLWNRGRYLAEGPAHCATCHTPRGFFMQELGDQNLQGASLGAWYAPDITSSKVNGIGSWSVDELTTYLATGRLEGKAQAGGPMAEAVTHSFSKLTKEDLRAISTYILSVPASEPSNEVIISRFEHGEAGDQLTAFRGKSYEAGMRLMDTKLGAQIYSANCASCHGASGQGSRDGYYPSLFGKSITGASDTTNLVAAILYGVDRETQQGGHVFMPPFGDQDNAMVPLDNREVAAVANYLLTSYGNRDVAVTQEDVQTIREGGPQSNLVLLARLGMGGGVVLVLLVVFWWWRRRVVARRAQ